MAPHARLQKQEEQMLIQLTLNCTMCIYVSTNPVTLSKGQRSLKQYTFVVLMGVYDQTNSILHQLSPPE